MAPSTTETTRYPAEITGRFASIQPEQFGPMMDTLYTSAKNITNAVVEEVEANRISTVQGAAVVANITGSLFGWPEFHRELRPSDLALSLIGNGK